ncbi:MAG: hypothetical protein PUC15_08020 [Lentisphaeria bacterium]|nr:hypothetical protein [Lentisphaeria bacterium]
MKITELHNGRDFVVSDCTREQAQCQKPNSNDFGIITLYNDRNAKEPEKRFAYAVYYRPNYITIWTDRDREIVTAGLQRKYDEARIDAMLDDWIDAEMGGRIQSNDTRTQIRAVVELQDKLEKSGISADFSAIETKAISIAERLFEDINNEN